MKASTAASHRVKRVTQAAHEQQPLVEAGERKPLDTRRDHRHETAPFSGRPGAPCCRFWGSIEKSVLSYKTKDHDLQYLFPAGAIANPDEIR